MEAIPSLTFKIQEHCPLHLGNPCRLLYPPAPGIALTHLDQHQAGQLLLSLLPGVFSLHTDSICRPPSRNSFSIHIFFP